MFTTAVIAYNNRSWSNSDVGKGSYDASVLYDEIVQKIKICLKGACIEMVFSAVLALAVFLATYEMVDSPDGGQTLTLPDWAKGVVIGAGANLVIGFGDIGFLLRRNSKNLDQSIAN